MKIFLALLFSIALCSGCAAKYVRIQADEIDGFMIYGPFAGSINAKNFLYLSAPGRGGKGQKVYEVDPGFYLGIKQPGGKETKGE